MHERRDKELPLGLVAKEGIDNNILLIVINLTA